MEYALLTLISLVMTRFQHDLLIFVTTLSTTPRKVYDLAARVNNTHTDGIYGSWETPANEDEIIGRRDDRRNFAQLRAER